MSVGERIQLLRKSGNLSQEELAEKAGVSRQAVSKWESEQSLPDIDKIILLSDFFHVTTDYILKGTESAPGEALPKKEGPNASIFSIIATAFNLMGIVVSAMIWYEEQNAAATAVGIIFLITGCMIYGIGMAIADKATTGKAKKYFLMINIWTIIFIPLSMAYNILSEAKGTAPYPILLGSPKMYILFWMIYIAIGTAGSLIIHYKKQSKLS